MSEIFRLCPIQEFCKNFAEHPESLDEDSNSRLFRVFEKEWKGGVRISLCMAGNILDDTESRCPMISIYHQAKTQNPHKFRPPGIEQLTFKDWLSMEETKG